MRRNVLTTLGVVALAWAVLAIVLGSPSLRAAVGLERLGRRLAPVPASHARAHSARCRIPTSTSRRRRRPVTANPDTQISFLGCTATQIREVSVVGQRSGSHSGQPPRLLAGRRRELRARQRRSTPARRVAVRAAIGAGSGAKRTGLQLSRRHPLPDGDHRATFPNLPAAPADYQSFYTLPGVQAPIMTVTVPDRDPAAGDILTTNGPGPGQYGPLIYTPQGRLVWFDRLPERRSRGEPERADLRRSARPDVVERARAHAGLRPGRRHRHELPLPDGRADHGRQRPEGGPARLPDRPPRDRLHHGVQPDPLQPHVDQGNVRTGRSSTRRSRRST